MEKNVSVIGAIGQTGRHIVQKLVAQNFAHNWENFFSELQPEVAGS